MPNVSVQPSRAEQKQAAADEFAARKRAEDDARAAAEALASQQAAQAAAAKVAAEKTAAESLAAKYSHLPATWVTSVGTRLIRILPGKFTMGSPETESGRGRDEGQVEVTLTEPYYLAQYELTQEEYDAVMGPTNWSKLNVQVGPRYPAPGSGWTGANEYCRQLSLRDRQSGQLLAGWEYALPSEAQWENACRAGSTTRFCYGDELPGLKNYAWYARNTKDAGEPFAHPVGLKKPNPLGFYDMHGNVFEWCRDGYVDKLPGGQDPLVSPTLVRVHRGGYWRGDTTTCRSANRESGADSSPHVGFRLAAVLSKTPPGIAAPPAGPAPKPAPVPAPVQPPAAVAAPAPSVAAKPANWDERMQASAQSWTRINAEPRSFDPQQPVILHGELAQWDVRPAVEERSHELSELSVRFGTAAAALDAPLTVEIRKFRQLLSAGTPLTLELFVLGGAPGQPELQLRWMSRTDANPPHSVLLSETKLKTDFEITPTDSKGLRNVEWSNQGSRLCISGAECTSWEVYAQKCDIRIDKDGQRACWDRLGTTVAIYDRTIQLYRRGSASIGLSSAQTPGPRGCFLHPRLNYIAVCELQAGRTTIALFEAKNGQRTREVASSAEGAALAWNPEGNRLAFAVAAPSTKSTAAPTAVLSTFAIPFQQNPASAPLKQIPTDIQWVAQSPLIAVYSTGIDLFNSEKLKQGSQGSVSGITLREQCAFSADARYLALIKDSGAVEVRSILIKDLLENRPKPDKPALGRVLWERQSSVGPFHAVAWHPANWLAAIDSQRRILAFDDKGRELLQLLVPFDNARLAFSPVGDRLVVWSENQPVLIYEVPKSLQKGVKS